MTKEKEQHIIKIIEQFCLYIESSTLGENDFLSTLQKHLLAIYSCGLDLSKNYSPAKEEYPDLLSDQAFREHLFFIIDQLKDYRYYWEVLNPADVNGGDIVCGDLADDIGDIYKDLKNVLLLYAINTEDAKADALWRLSFLFHAHWGTHCINALRACHYFSQ